jgi:hypothetical protein
MTNLAIVLGLSFFLFCLVLVAWHSLRLERLTLLDWAVIGMTCVIWPFRDFHGVEALVIQVIYGVVSYEVLILGFNVANARMKGMRLLRGGATA